MVFGHTERESALAAPAPRLEAEDSKCSLGEQTRHVKHFHYVKWPDMRVPDKLSMLDFVRLVRGHVDHSRASPIIIHCSAGVGRTGTFIALDVLAQQLQHEDMVDVFAVVYQMRMSRVLMVQTEQQYVFIHECVRHILNERNRICSQFTAKQNGEVVYVNCLDLESPEESITEEIDDTLSDEGIEDEICDGK